MHVQQTVMQIITAKRKAEDLNDSSICGYSEKRVHDEMLSSS